jgi:hypothetical protein
MAARWPFVTGTQVYKKKFHQLSSKWFDIYGESGRIIQISDPRFCTKSTSTDPTAVTPAVPVYNINFNKTVKALQYKYRGRLRCTGYESPARRLAIATQLPGFTQYTQPKGLSLL